jgi:hypothetical protein
VFADRYFTLAPSGAGKLPSMTWPWLTGDPVQLFYFIAAVIGFPASVAFVVQLVRRALSRHAARPAIPPAPTVFMGAPRSTGGAFSTDGPFAYQAPVVPISNDGLRTITLKPEREWYKLSLSQSAPCGEPAKGGFPVYPAGL